MAENTGIEWTDATVNFWWGCTKVGPGCDFCYAESWSKRFGENIWGVGAPRRKIKGTAALLNRLDNGYAEWARDYEVWTNNAKVFGLPAPTIGRRRRVFIQSMSDLFDTEVPIEWFAEAWGKIVQCNRIDIQIVTKRVSVVEKRLAEIGVTTWPKHAGLLISVVNQPEAERDIPRLLALKAKLGIPWVGISAEPLLGEIQLRRLEIKRGLRLDALTGYFNTYRSDTHGLTASEMEAAMHSLPARLPPLDWIIVGAESGRDARQCHPDWIGSLRDQTAIVGTALFVKQLSGERGKVIKDIAAFPADLQIRQYPEVRSNG